MRRHLLLALTLVALPLASCTDPLPVAPNIATANFDPSLGVNLAASTVTPSGLYYRDITVGSGATVPSTGSTSVRVNYTGYFRSGTSFDSGVFDFTTNNCCAIDGMDEGVRGMQVIRVAVARRIDDLRVVVDGDADLRLAERADAVREDHEEKIDEEHHPRRHRREPVEAEAALGPVPPAQRTLDDGLGLRRRVARLIRIVHGTS